MQVIQLSAAVALALAASGVQAAMVNSPPSLIQCQPAAITWSGAQPPVFLSAVQGKDTSAAPLKQFPQQNAASGSYAWTVDVAAGTQVTLVINDATGQPNFSGQVTVQQGTTTSCGNTGSGSSGSSASSPPAASGSASNSSAPRPTSSGAVSASAPTNSSGTSPTTSGTSATTSGSAANSTTSSKTSGAAATYFNANGALLSGVAALVGAAYALA